MHTDILAYEKKADSLERGNCKYKEVDVVTL